MKLLLDTNAALWAAAAPELLSPSAAEALRDRDNDLFLSAATAWELSIKFHAGRLVLPIPLEHFLDALSQEFDAEYLPIEIQHALHAGQLPPVHRDPFDRMLVAQAQVDGLSVVTSDAHIARYDVPVIW